MTTFCQGGEYVEWVTKHLLNKLGNPRMPLKWNRDIFGAKVVYTSLLVKWWIFRLLHNHTQHSHTKTLQVLLLLWLLFAKYGGSGSLKKNASAAAVICKREKTMFVKKPIIRRVILNGFLLLWWATKSPYSQISLLIIYESTCHYNFFF